MTWINTEERLPEILPEISINQALRYEVSGSWWANLISNNFLQDLSARYFAWKVKLKYVRYQKWRSVRNKMDAITGGVK